MSNLRKAMDHYFNGRNIIFETFKWDGWEAIENQTDKRWFYDGGGLEFLDEEGTEYSYESADKCGETVDGIEMYYLQENGEKFYGLFTTDLKLGGDEYEEEIGKEI